MKSQKNEISKKKKKKKKRNADYTFKKLSNSHLVVASSFVNYSKKIEPRWRNYVIWTAEWGAT